MNIREHVIRLDSTKGSYCYLVNDNGAWSLIDTGFGFLGGRAIREISRLGIGPDGIRHILITHHDVDHVGNLHRFQQWTGADVWAHERDIPYITGKEKRYGFKKHLGKLAKRVELVHPYPESGRVGNVSVHETPGHTPGHVCLLFENVLFAGDLVKSEAGVLTPYPDPWNWDTSMLRASVQALKGVRFSLVCPAHGEPVPTGALPLWENC